MSTVNYGRGYGGDNVRKMYWVASFDPNICVFIIGTQGDKRGFILGVMGDITPNATYQGLPIYEATWNVVTGEFIISFGLDGTTYVENSPEILLTHYLVPDGNIATWDAAQTAYVYTDLALAQAIDTDTSKSCFWVEQKYEHLISYDYSKIYTGTGV